MKTLTLAGMTCLVSALMLGCGSSTPTYKLQFKYTPGAVYSYQHMSKGSVLAKQSDTIFTNQENVINSNFTFTVRRVVDDTAWEVLQQVQSTYHSLNLIDSTEKDTSYSPPNLTFYMAPSGRIVDCEYASNDRGMDNAAYMKEYLRQGSPVFPDQPVPIGYSWTQTYDVSVNGSPVQVATTYTIQKCEQKQGKDCVALAYSGKMVIPFEASPSDSLKRHGVDRLTNEGIMYHSVKDGMTVAQTERWVLEGDRLKLKDSVEIPYTVHADYQVTYDLKAVSKQ